MRLFIDIVTHVAADADRELRPVRSGKFTRPHSLRFIKPDAIALVKVENVDRSCDPEGRRDRAQRRRDSANVDGDLARYGVFSLHSIGMSRRYSR